MPVYDGLGELSVTRLSPAAARPPRSYTQHGRALPHNTSQSPRAGRKNLHGSPGRG